MHVIFRRKNFRIFFMNPISINLFEVKWICVVSFSLRKDEYQNRNACSCTLLLHWMFSFMKSDGFISTPAPNVLTFATSIGTLFWSYFAVDEIKNLNFPSTKLRNYTCTCNCWLTTIFHICKIVHYLLFLMEADSLASFSY